MTSPDPAAILAQINAAREQTYQNIELAQGILDQANAAASAAARDRAAIQAIAQQTVSVDTSVGTRVFAGDEMIYGDTGWRDVSEEFFNPDADATFPEKGTVRLRRIGNTVRLVIADLKKSTDASSTSDVARIPYGWRPDIHMTFPGVVSGSANSRVSIPTHGRVSFYGMSEFDWSDHYYAVSWTTRQNWPTSLPGTAV